MSCFRINYLRSWLKFSGRPEKKTNVISINLQMNATKQHNCSKLKLVFFFSSFSGVFDNASELFLFSISFTLNKFVCWAFDIEIHRKNIVSLLFFVVIVVYFVRFKLLNWILKTLGSRLSIVVIVPKFRWENFNWIYNIFFSVVLKWHFLFGDTLSRYVD